MLTTMLYWCCGIEPIKERQCTGNEQKKTKIPIIFIIYFIPAAIAFLQTWKKKTRNKHKLRARVNASHSTEDGSENSYVITNPHMAWPKYGQNGSGLGSFMRYANSLIVAS